MKGKNQQEWVEAGYLTVAEQGLGEVKVEALARMLNKNKSSFYHYFGDWAGFEEALLSHHLGVAKSFAAEVSKCEHIIPHLANLFLAHKTDIFFHKQLRINRENPHFRACFEGVFSLFEQAVHDKWITFLNLENRSLLASRFLALISENFLLQITPQKFTYEWLTAYLLEQSKLMQDLYRPGPGV